MCVERKFDTTCPCHEAEFIFATERNGGRGARWKAEVFPGGGFLCKTMTEAKIERLSQGTKVVVATSVMLTFISFWRAAAIVLADLGSSAFYVGGIAEQAVGQSAPWFIFAVMLFSYAVRAVYIESCTMFTRGGVYRVVKEAMGSTLAKLSVSALIFDFILTGPISAVSAGQYIVGFIAQILNSFGMVWHPEKGTVNSLSALVAIFVTLYFWRRNTQGIHESSKDALRIMSITTVMVVMLICWSALTIAISPDTRRLPPSPVPANLSFNEEALGWVKDIAPQYFEAQAGDAQEPRGEHAQQNRFGIVETAGSLFALFGLLVAFGHSVLAMSGEETLAQVNRELAHPKHKNLMRAGLIIFVYSLLFTSIVSFSAYAIIPDHVRPHYFDNLIAGIAMHLAGPHWLKMLFQGFIVVVGFLMLSGAVNTAIIGSNGVLNRVAEDGVLAEWFRKPHRKYGTSYRLINLVVLLQLATIIGSCGEIYVLGEAYAFGVVWSFAFNGLAMLVLRFKDFSSREWRVPGNLRLGRVEIPLGLGSVALLLFAVGLVNLLTKQVATIAGVALTIVFFALFYFSERLNERRRRLDSHGQTEQFSVALQDQVSDKTLGLRPGNILCLVRDYNSLDHFRYTLAETDSRSMDLVAMTVHVIRTPGEGHEILHESDVFTDYEQMLFSKVVSLAEKEGKPVHLLAVPSPNVYQAIVQTALRLQSSAIVCGRSSFLTPRQLAGNIGSAWEEMNTTSEQQVRCRVVGTDGTIEEYFLGAHTPELDPEDIQLIHHLWLQMVRRPGNESLHHKDVVKHALREFRSRFSALS